MGGLKQHLIRDDSLRPRLWPAKQRIPGGVSWHICYTGKWTQFGGEWTLMKPRGDVPVETVLISKHHSLE